MKHTAPVIPTIVAVFAAAWITGTDISEAAPLPSYDRVRVLPAAHVLNDVTLIDTTGKPLPMSHLQGKVAFIFFGFTNCPDICPLSMQRLRDLYASGMVDTDKVVFVLVSVDGERDTPEAMKNFLAGYSPDFLGLTGDPKEVKKLTAQFRAPFFKGNEAGTPGSQGYTVAHSPQIYAVDAAGVLRAEFYNASFEAMAGIAAALVAEIETDAKVAAAD